MRASRRDLLFGLGLIAWLVLAVWAAVALASQTANKLLRQDAQAEGESWARYLATNVRDLGAIVAGAKPSEESRDFFEQAQKVGDVFRYKIYGADGALRLTSDELEAIDSPAESITRHNPAVAEAVLHGKPVIEVKDGDDSEEEEEGEEAPEEHAAGQPAFYSEAYIPVVVDGGLSGIVETYVDQTVKRDAFRAAVAAAALGLAAIIALAFGLPAVALYARTRQKRQAESRAEFLADHDSLTGLLNRARFMRDLDAAAGLGCAVAVHCIDLERFGEINETLGHAAGDEALREVARRLQALTSRHDLLARLGGDEFGIAQIVSDPRQVEQAPRRLVAALAEPVHLKGQDVVLAGRVGTAVAPRHGQDAASLVKSADLALSHCKSDGSARSSLFRPEMDAELWARRELETQVRRAVDAGAFELHFQPIYRAGDTGLNGFEALLRLPVEGGGCLSPAVFIPLAERLGLIVPIGEWVLRRACEVASALPESMIMAVNLSPLQFQDGRLAGVVQGALATSGLAPHQLELEITEGLLLSDSDWIMRQLKELKALGVRVAMDDFGTGYSSLSYLWKFPFDKLKIDQSFVRAHHGADDHLDSVIRAIVALGHSLGMVITAEGVETAAQAEFLRQIGCDQLQGFHLGRPMPVDNLAGEILRNFASTRLQEAATEPAPVGRVAAQG